MYNGKTLGGKKKADAFVFTEIRFTRGHPPFYFLVLLFSQKNEIITHKHTEESKPLHFTQLTLRTLVHGRWRGELPTQSQSSTPGLQQPLDKCLRSS